jgi:hypothetical protein
MQLYEVKGKKQKQVVVSEIERVQHGDFHKLKLPNQKMATVSKISQVETIHTPKYHLVLSQRLGNNDCLF